MNTISRKLSLLAAIILTIALGACSDDDNDSTAADYAAALLGSWEKVSDSAVNFEFVEIEFRNGGTAIAKYPDNSSITPSPDATQKFITKTLAYEVVADRLRLYTTATPGSDYATGQMFFFSDNTMVFKYVQHTSAGESTAANTLELKRK